MNDTNIDLGDIARDRITSLEGVVICRMQYQYGCLRFGIQPRELKDGRPVDPSFFDVGQLDLVSKVVPAFVPSETGGPSPTPSRRPDPKR